MNFLEETMERMKPMEQKPLVKRTFGQVWEQWQRKKRTMVSDSLNDTYSMFREQYIAPFADMQMAEFGIPTVNKIRELVRATPFYELLRFKSENCLPLFFFVDVTLGEVVVYAASHRYIRRKKATQIMRYLR